MHTHPGKRLVGGSTISTIRGIGIDAGRRLHGPARGQGIRAGRRHRIRERGDALGRRQRLPVRSIEIADDGEGEAQTRILGKAGVVVVEGGGRRTAHEIPIQSEAGIGGIGGGPSRRLAQAVGKGRGEPQRARRQAQRGDEYAGATAGARNGPAQAGSARQNRVLAHGGRGGAHEQDQAHRRHENRPRGRGLSRHEAGDQESAGRYEPAGPGHVPASRAHENAGPGEQEAGQRHYGGHRRRDLQRRDALADGGGRLPELRDGGRVPGRQSRRGAEHQHGGDEADDQPHDDGAHKAMGPDGAHRPGRHQGQGCDQRALDDPGAGDQDRSQSAQAVRPEDDDEDGGQERLPADGIGRR